MTLVTVAELPLKLPLMQPQQLRKKASWPTSSRRTDRTTRSTKSYLKTRIRGARLQNAAGLLALIELTHRLHQAYAQAYDKQAADRLLPQNSGFKLGGPDFSDSQKKILSVAFNVINEADCKKFINETLAKHKVDKAVDSLDKLLNKATFGYYDVNADYTNTDLGVDMHSTIILRDIFVNRGASAGGVGTRVFLTDKVFERSSSIIPIQSWNRVADTPSYIVHELFHVAGIDKSIIDSQQMTDAIRQNCRLVGSDRIIISH